MQKLARYALLMVLLVSCNREVVIPEKDMVSILTKIQIIDASVQSFRLREAYFNKDTIDYYSRTIQSYGYTEEQFDSSLSFYTKRPKEFDAIYDKVIIELSKLETKFTAENKNIIDSIAKDTLKNLWNLRTSYHIPDDGSRSKIDFMIPVNGLGVYTISADVLIHDDDATVNPSMEAYFYFDDKSKDGRKSGITTKSYSRVKDTLTYSMQLELKNSLVTHLKGSLYNHSNADTNFTKHATIMNIKISHKPGKLKSIKVDPKRMRLRQQESPY
ncbi:MAG: DUF4296 domain-containing protein [Bacteroidales bacterium]|nr:MAG: DUF4296 domain-containing protein [Bacteroidales bacterium]